MKRNEKRRTNGQNRKKSNNAKKNYKKGPRKKVAQLMLYCGLLPFKGLILLEGNYQTLCKKIDEMRSTDENILEKRKECGIWIIGFKTFYENTKFHNLMIENFSKELYDFYEQNGRRYWKKAKSKDETDLLRMVRNAETIMFMDRLPVRYIPGEKPKLTFTDNIEVNAFYTTKEMREDMGGITSLTGSRNNGYLTTFGGNYFMYNFGDSMMQIDSGHEIRLYNGISAHIVESNSRIFPVPIILYRAEKVIINLLCPNCSRQTEWILNLEMSYNNVYAVPLDQNGQKVVAMMCKKDWKSILTKWLLPKKTMHPDIPSIVNDGVIPYETGERFVFLFCIPDIKRFRKFMVAAKRTNKKEMFEVRCYDYQVEVLRKLISEYAYINAIPLEIVYNYFQEKNK